MGMRLEDLASSGDPDGMEAFASDLVLRADAVAGVARSLSRQVEEMAYEGPAALQLREQTADRRRRAQKVVSDLNALAELLKVRAAEARGEIEHAQAAQRRDRELDR